MKRITGLLLIILILSPTCAASEDIYERQYAALEADKLSDVLPKDAEGIELSPDISFEKGLSDIWKTLREDAGDIFSEGMRCIIRVIAVSVLCSAAGAMSAAEPSEMQKLTISLVGAIAVTAAASGSISSVIGMGRSVISEIDAFSKALLPTVAAAEAASGAAGSALAKAGAAVLFSDVLITVINGVLIPLVYVNIFAAAANAAVPNGSLKRIGDLAAKTVSGSLKIALGAFVSYITVTGLVSGSVDRAGLRAAELAAGSVPVVGGIMAGAAKTVLAGAGVVKNTVGVFGLLVIISACAVPAATMAVNYMTFKAASIFAAPMIDGALSELCERIGQSFGLVLAMVFSCALVMFIAIAAAMKSMGVV